jgi:hypothetical protein
MSHPTSPPPAIPSTISAQQVAERWPEAVARARELREVFGDGVRMFYARNAEGDELGRDLPPLRMP